MAICFLLFFVRESLLSSPCRNTNLTAAHEQLDTFDIILSVYQRFTVNGRFVSQSGYDQFSAQIHDPHLCSDFPGVFCLSKFEQTCSLFPPGSFFESNFKWKPGENALIKCQTYHPPVMSKPGTENYVSRSISLHNCRRIFRAEH